MSGTLYEFEGGKPAGPRRWWLILPGVVGVLAAAAWGVSILERKRSEALVEEAFRLEVDVDNNVISAIAQGSELQDEAVESLELYPGLKIVDLSGTRSVASGLASLEAHRGLRVLCLNGCEWVDDEQAAVLKSIPTLRALDLSGTRVTDAALATVSTLPELETLKLEGCRGITDRGLAMCAEMNQLRELWPGGAGYTYDGLLELRERRRDLNLQLKRSDVAGPSVENFGPDDSAGFLFNARTYRHTTIKAHLSTMADVEALARLLRFPQNWDFGGHGELCRGGYFEGIEETWKTLNLDGPFAVGSLASLFPLTPRLTTLGLIHTSIDASDFPSDQSPPELRRLWISSSTINDSFFHELGQHVLLSELVLHDIVIDGSGATDPDGQALPPAGPFPALRQLDITNSLLRESFWRALGRQQMLVDLRLANVAIRGFEDSEDSFLAADEIPAGLIPRGLRLLIVRDAVISHAFLRALSEEAALDQLSLTRVQIRNEGGNGDPVFGALTSLRSLSLADVSIDGVDLTNSKWDPLRQRMRRQLRHTSISIGSSASGEQIHWMGQSGPEGEATPQ